MTREEKKEARTSHWIGSSERRNEKRKTKESKNEEMKMVRRRRWKKSGSKAKAFRYINVVKIGKVESKWYGHQCVKNNKISYSYPPIHKCFTYSRVSRRLLLLFTDVSFSFPCDKTTANVSKGSHFSFYSIDMKQQQPTTAEWKIVMVIKLG